MKTNQIVLGFILSVVGITSLAAPVFAEDDWEQWNTLKFVYKITDKTSFILNPKTQIRDDVRDFYYYESVQGFSHKLNDNFDVGIFHLYADKKNTAGKWTDENRARVDVTWNKKFGNFKFSDRNRYEYRVIGGKPKSRYRNRIKLGRPVEVWGHKITPYISNEFFIDFRLDEFNQNRASVGVSKKLTEKITGEIYYMMLSEKTGSDWNEVNIIGTSFTFKI